MSSRRTSSPRIECRRTGCRILKMILAAAIHVAVSRTSLLAEVTFSKEIAPIVFANCTACHRPGEGAPFSLQTYADVKKRGELIGEVIASRQMPPWKAAAGDISFQNERRLSADQIHLFAQWIEAGMPEGDPAHLPPLPQFTAGWSLGEPDLIVTMPASFTVPADGPDIYRNFVVPLGLKTDRWVKAIDFRPRARSVVHHSLFFFESNGLARTLDDEDPQTGFKGGMGAMMRLRGGPPVLAADAAEEEATPSTGPQNGNGLNPLENIGKAKPATFGTLGGWALGARPQPLPEGLAYRLPAGSDLILATHFHPSGKTEEEASTVGIYFANEPITRRFTAIQLPTAFGAFKNIDIPPGKAEYVIEDSFALPVAVQAFGVGAHAHYLGKSMTMTATLPSGETRVLLSIPDWDFAWQEQYRFAEYLSLPQGTVLRSRITYDNSVDNPRNPSDPPVRVRFGEESTNEMGAVTLMVVAANESLMPQLLDGYRNHFRQSLLQTPLFRLFNLKK